VYRSSSLFYNPNLFAYYCVLIYLAIIYFSENLKNSDIKTTIISFALLFCILISGARGIFLFMLISMAVIAILNKKIKLLYLYPYILYLMCALVTITQDSKFLINLDNRNNLFENFYYLSNRFFSIPIDIFIYISKDASPMSTMSANSQLSIDGRFCRGCDNGWIILYRDLGLFGIFSFLFLYLYICLNIVKSNNIYRNNKSILLSAILFIILVSSSMRFQILTVTVVTATYICLLLIITRNK